MKMIDDIIIKQLGFRTTPHGKCIYTSERDNETQLLLRLLDDYMVGVTSEKVAKYFQGL